LGQQTAHSFLSFSDSLKVFTAHAYQFMNDYAKLLEISYPPILYWLV